MTTLNIICERLLLKMCSWNWEHLFIMSFDFTLKTRFFQHQYQKQVHDWYFMIGFHELFIYIQYFFSVVTPNKRRSKVQEKNISCERALNFDQWETFSKNYKPMRVWLWLVYKFFENYCRLRLFSEFIQIQKRYSTSLDKARVLTWKLIVISS